MMHLTPDEIVDAVEESLPGDRAAHLASCPTCSASVDELTRLLHRARDVAVPEPSSAFWQQFSRRVRAALDAEDAPTAPVTAWLRWPVLVPFSALALLVATLTVSMPRSPATPEPSISTAGATESTDAAGAADEERSWATVSDIVGPVGLDEVERAGLVLPPGAADRAISQLTSSERAELSRLLTLALERPES